MSCGVSVRVSCGQVGSRDSAGARRRPRGVLSKLPQRSPQAGGNALRKVDVCGELGGIYVRSIAFSTDDFPLNFPYRLI